MKRVLCTLSLWLAGLAVSIAVADLQPIPTEQAGNIAKRLAEAGGKITGAPIKLEVDCEKATGLYEEGVGGLMIIPRQGLKEGDTQGVEEPTGAPLAYLCLHQLVPAVDDKPIDAAKIHTVNVQAGDQERPITILHLSVKKESDTEWKLLVFGKDKKPIASSTFRGEESKSDLPVSVTAKDQKDNKVTLIIHVHGKYAADVKLIGQ